MAQTQPETFDGPEAAADALIDAGTARRCDRVERDFRNHRRRPCPHLGRPGARRSRNAQEFVNITEGERRIGKTISIDPNRKILLIGDDDSPLPGPRASKETTAGVDVSKTRASTQTGCRARRIGADQTRCSVEIFTGFISAGTCLRQTPIPRIFTPATLSILEPDVPKGFVHTDLRHGSQAVSRVPVLRPRVPGRHDSPGGRHDYMVKETQSVGGVAAPWRGPCNTAWHRRCTPSS